MLVHSNISRNSRTMKRLLIQVGCFFCVGLMSLSLLSSAQTGQDYDVLVQQGNAQLQAGSNDLALSTANSAVKLNADRWEAYALAGGALMNLKRYEEAVDNFGKAIERAPEAKQQGLRGLRKQCLLAEAGAAPAAVPPSSSAATQPAATTQASRTARTLKISKLTSASIRKEHLLSWQSAILLTSHNNKSRIKS